MKYALAAGLWAASYSLPVNAESVYLRGGVGAAHAVGGYQQDELSFGVNAFAGAEFRLAPEVAASAKLVGLSLTPGGDSDDPSVASPDGASLYGGTLSLVLYPGVSPGDGQTLNGPSSGLWLAAGGGGAVTGGLGRPIFDASVGWDLYWPAASFGLGPFVNLLHVFQPNDAVRPDDANVISLGVSGRFGVGPIEAPGDRDGDRIADPNDRCPTQAEDLDGFEDNDGCPENDNDNDGVSDDVDMCPDEAGDSKGVSGEDGCPDRQSAAPTNDRDEDGIPDERDRCPSEPEDRDDFQDEDGCPDADNDEDQVLDTKDLCPNEPETVNDYADNDGCPDEDQVRVVGGEIVLDDVVHFATNSAEVSKRSYDLLKRLAKLIREHPEYVHISVEGHADLRGTEEQNVELSADRARSVLEFLVKEGIEANRLSSKGFGSSRPRGQGRDEQTLSKNRRVEFVVTRAGTVPAAGRKNSEGKP